MSPARTQDPRAGPTPSPRRDAHAENARTQEIVIEPLPWAPLKPPMRMRYCAPAVAVNETTDWRLQESSLQASARPEETGQVVP